jgi:hypothetical protein
MGKDPEETRKWLEDYIDDIRIERHRDMFLVYGRK